MQIELTAAQFYNYLNEGNPEELQHNLKHFLNTAGNQEEFIKAVEAIENYYIDSNPDIMQEIKDGAIYLIKNDPEEVQNIKDNYNFYVQEITEELYLIIE